MKFHWLFTNLNWNLDGQNIVFYLCLTMKMTMLMLIPINIIFTIKDTYVLVVTLSGKDNQKLSKRLSKGSERSMYCNEYKKVRTKIQQKVCYWIKLSWDWHCLLWFIQTNMVVIKYLMVLFNGIKKYYLWNNIIKNYNFLVNRKNFNNQSAESDIKPYE